MTPGREAGPGPADQLRPDPAPPEPEGPPTREGPARAPPRTIAASSGAPGPAPPRRRGANGGRRRPSPADPRPRNAARPRREARATSRSPAGPPGGRRPALCEAGRRARRAGADRGIRQRPRRASGWPPGHAPPAPRRTLDRGERGRATRSPRRADGTRRAHRSPGPRRSRMAAFSRAAPPCNSFAPSLHGGATMRAGDAATAPMVRRARSAPGAPRGAGDAKWRQTESGPTLPRLGDADWRRRRQVAPDRDWPSAPRASGVPNGVSDAIWRQTGNRPASGLGGSNRWNEPGSVIRRSEAGRGCELPGDEPPRALRTRRRAAPLRSVSLAARRGAQVFPGPDGAPLERWTAGPGRARRARGRSELSPAPPPGREGACGCRRPPPARRSPRRRGRRRCAARSPGRDPSPGMPRADDAR